MSQRSLPFKLVKLVAITAILAGCTYLCWDVSLEYFHYKTNSVIAIRDYQEEDIRVPGISFCLRFLTIGRYYNATIGELFTGETNYFNDKNDTWEAIRIITRLSREEIKRMKLVTKKYLIGNRYCYFVQVDNPFRMEEVTSTKYRGLPKFFYVVIPSDHFHSPIFWGNPHKGCTPKFLYVSLVMNQSSLSNLRTREVLKEVCTKGFKGYDAYITYSSMVSVRLPPPYDSDCRDYRKEGLHLSMNVHECYDYCLKEKTKKWNVIPSGTLLDREKYNQSHQYILSEPTLEEYLENTNITILKRRMSKAIMEKYLEIGKEWNGIKRSCRESCHRPDCRSEDVSPQITLFEGISKYGNETLTYLQSALLLSYQPTLEVTTIPKQKLLDYIIYMSSMLSFWIGFCPLTLTDSVIEKLREWTKKKGMTMEETIRRMEITNDERFGKLERGHIRLMATVERMRSTQEKILSTLERITTTQHGLSAIRQRRLQTTGSLP